MYQPLCAGQWGWCIRHLWRLLSERRRTRRQPWWRRLEPRCRPSMRETSDQSLPVQVAARTAAGVWCHDVFFFRD